MRKSILTIILFTAYITVSAQTVDFTSVDEFFNFAQNIQNGEQISDKEWETLFNTGGYKVSTKREIRKKIIKEIPVIAFNPAMQAERDSILNIDEKKATDEAYLWLSKHTLMNYLDMQNNFDELIKFRNEYDFIALIQKAKEKFSSFLKVEIDSTTAFRPIYFLCQEDDSQLRSSGIFADYNSFYNESEKERVEFLAHEMFHDYRRNFSIEKYYNKNYFNAYMDNIQNEGIADLIDKSAGYEESFKSTGPEVIEIWVTAYNNVPNVIMEIEKTTFSFIANKITEKEFDEKLHEVIKFSGHPVGFYMSSLIVKAGYKNEMLEDFYNPCTFFTLYNKAAKQLNNVQFSDKFMDYLKETVEGYYYN